MKRPEQQPDNDSQLSEYDYDPSYDDTQVYDTSYDDVALVDHSYDDLGEKQSYGGSGGFGKRESRREQALRVGTVNHEAFNAELAISLTKTLSIYHHLEELLNDLVRSKDTDEDQIRMIQTIAGTMGVQLLGFVCSYQLFHSQWDGRKTDPRAAIALAQIVGQNITILSAVQDQPTAASAPFLPAERVADLYTDEVRLWLGNYMEDVPDISFA